MNGHDQRSVVDVKFSERRRFAHLRRARSMIDTLQNSQ
jgi:hypothetical protein